MHALSAQWPAFANISGNREVVTDAEAQLQIAEFEARECIALSKAGVLFYWLDCVQMRLAIFRHDIALRIDKDLRIVNGRTTTLRNAADDRNRKFSRNFTKPGDESSLPKAGMLLDHWH